MIGIVGGAEVCLVAGVAIDGRAYVFVVGVALRAGNVGVHSGKWIAGVGGVVEPGTEPTRSGMADGALVWQTGGHMRRIAGCDEVFLVTGVAGCGRALEPVVDVAGDAVEGCMDSGKGKAGDFEVIELRAKPVVNGVAGFAGCGEAGRHVIDDGSFEVPLMAGVAGR